MPRTPHQSVLTSVLATRPSKVSRTALRTPYQVNHEIRDSDHQNIDGIDDSDDESDDDDEDDSEDDHEDDQNEVAGSPLRPRVPVNLASKESAPPWLPSPQQRIPLHPRTDRWMVQAQVRRAALIVVASFRASPKSGNVLHNQ
jgi:hypothetical protein